ncbi:MAG: transglutaminase domain-containing protein, partial [Candidatus Latescibacterota bacterium]|nr:transglutaminase domain-containing protein [Candidatus Latescibacterota bacterium]
GFRVDRLLKQYRLEDVIAPGKTQLEQIAILRDWVHSQWLGWQARAYPFCPSWDPIEILETTKGNWGFGMCTHYGAVFAGCASALGWVARVVIIDHHCLAEVWSEDLQKWILQDAGPGKEHDATYESRGVPVNAVEFSRMHEAGTSHHLTINKLPKKMKTRMTRSWGSLFVRFGIPLRNNHLVQAEPAELYHGYSAYHWDGYLWWSVDIDP